MPRVTIKNDFTPADPYSETDANNIGTNLLHIYDENSTFNGEKTFTGIVSVEAGATDGFYLNGKKHCITSGDGTGDLSIRVGNTSETGDKMTVNGYGHNDNYDITTGTRKFQTTTASQLVGEVPVLNTPLELFSNKVALRSGVGDGNVSLHAIAWTTSESSGAVFTRLESILGLTLNQSFATMGNREGLDVATIRKTAATVYSIYNSGGSLLQTFASGSATINPFSGHILVSQYISM